MGWYEELALLALSIAAVLSVAAYLIADRILPTSNWLQAIGGKLYEQKLAMLKKPPLSYYQAAAENGEFLKGYLIIAAGILLKSLTTLFAGLIAIVFLPASIGTIPALTAQVGTDLPLRHWMARVTAMQAASHLFSACIGFSATWIWITSNTNPIETIQAAPLFTGTLIAASLLTGLLAAWIETDGHMNYGFLNKRG